MDTALLEFSREVERKPFADSAELRPLTARLVRLLNHRRGVLIDRGTLVHSFISLSHELRSEGTAKAKNSLADFSRALSEAEHRAYSYQAMTAVKWLGVAGATLISIVAMEFLDSASWFQPMIRKLWPALFLPVPFLYYWGAKDIFLGPPEE